MTEPGTGSGTGFHWWVRYRFRCEIQFRSGPSRYNRRLHSSTMVGEWVRLKLLTSVDEELVSFVLILNIVL